MTQVYPSLLHGRCFAIPKLLEFVVAALLWTICLGDETRAAGSGVVTAFLDETGQLHWGGQTYLKNKGLASEVGDSPTVQAPLCESGLLAQASYGSAVRNISVIDTLYAGESLILTCSEAFERNEFTGHFLLRCVAARTVELEYHCGCAAGPLPRPKLKAKRSHLHPMCSAPPKRSAADQTSTTPDFVWSSGSLADGAAEDRLCSELSPGMTGAWKIRCFEGRLCSEVESCLPQQVQSPTKDTLPWQVPPIIIGTELLRPENISIADTEVTVGSTADEEEAEEEELRWQNSVSRRMTYANTTAAFTDSRRLVAVALCLDPPKDNWWPDICRTTADTPYSTVAGAWGHGESLEQLNWPYGIFVSPINDDLYIADWKNHRIQKWPQGEGIGLVQTIAGETGQIGDANDLHLLFNPSDIVVSQTVGSSVCGEMFIADESNNRVLRWPPYSDNGFVMAGGPDGELDHPSGIWVTDELDVYIADRLHNRVILYSKDFYRLEWKQNPSFFAGLKNKAPGSSLDALDRPSDVALNANKDVFVADFGNNRLVRWRHGETVATYIGRCFAIYSVFVNGDGLIFAACQTTHCIKRWELVGGSYQEGPITGQCAFFVQAPIQTDPTYGASLGRFFSPSGVFVDKYGNIYVSDTGNSRVVKRGRDPLTQWIMTNGASTGYKFQISRLEFYPDLNCSQPLTIKTNISADGVVPNLPWEPSCSLQGNNRCAKNDAWLGRQFTEAVAIRCTVLELSYTNTGGQLFDAAVRYWTGSYFRTVYTFGKIPSGTPTKMRYPRFDADGLSCVKGQRSCTIIFTGDWQADGDRVMFTEGTCTGSMNDGLLGFPMVGMSEPSVSGGTSFTIGDPNTPDFITIDANAGDRYKICWCDKRLKNCELGTDFTLFVAYLTLEGPFDIQQQYGWRGSPLNLTLLQGVSLKPGDRLTVISGKCGLAATDVVGIPRQPGLYIAASAPSITGVDYNWGTTVMNTDPDTYELCWCRTNQYNPCSELLDYQAQAGRLSVNGPEKKQQFVCVKGDPCKFDVTGVNIEVGDSILILARCGQGPLLNGFPWQGIPKTVTRSTSRGTLGKYGWGPYGITPTVGMYYICWCAAQFDPTEPEDFSVEVGFMTIAGPEEKPLLCALGADCVVQLTGVEMWRTKRAMVVLAETECGSNSSGPVPGFPGDSTVSEGVSYLATGDGTTLTWGYVDQTKVKPDTYKACWCHTGSPCASLEDYKVSLGQMTIIGPKEWTAIQYCGVGKQCIVELLGLGLSAKDTMVLIDGACGTSKLAQTSNIDDAKSGTDTGDDHYWLADQMTTYGAFSVCWCSNNCVNPAAYKMTVGTMMVSSPAPNQEVACTSGKVCNVRLEGFGLRDTDRIAIVTPECGNKGMVVPGVPNQGRSITTTSYSSYADFTLGVDDNGTNVVKSNGGYYAICWCPSRCNSVRDYLYNSGQLTIWGPDGDHSYICYNGKACTLQGIRGIGLQDGDKVRASSTCTIMLLVGGLPQQGVSLEATNAGATFTWGPNKLKAIVGKYRLCWCSKPHDCGNPMNYLTDLGSLIIGGPVAGQSEVCQAGYLCELIGIEGFGLQAGDFIVILFTCGVGNPIYRGYVEGTPWTAWPPFMSGEKYGCDGTSGKCSSDYRKGDNFIFNADTGKYRMCWCDGKTGTCTKVEDFTVDIGLFTAVGPDADQEYFCVPGFTCTLNAVAGVSLSNGDQYALQIDPECVGGEVVQGVPNNGISNPSTASGRMVTWESAFSPTTWPAPDYTLCWCPEKVSCTSPGEFVTRAAVIVVVGPWPDHVYQCLLGDPCILRGVRGVGLQNKDRILVVAGACGPGAVVAPNFPSNALTAPAEETGTKYSMEMLVNARTGGYRLCWCPYSRTIDPIYPVPFECLKNGSIPINEDFAIDLGELQIPELPLPGEVRTCISGTHCVIDGFVGSTGTHLPNGSQILVKINQSMADEYTCADDSETVQGFPNDAESNPATLGGTSFAWGNVTVNESIWAEGGRYIMCWRAAGVGYYAYLLGFLWVEGPGNEEQTFTCTKSARCKIENIEGYGMSDGDYFRVMQPCAGNLAEDIAREGMVGGVPRTEMESGVVTWEPSEFQAAPKYYNLCWCHRGNACTKPFDFKTTVGTMIVNGPRAGQNRKCDRGQACLVSNIDGINLRENDEAQVLVECGVGPDVEGLTPEIVSAKADTDAGNGRFYFWWYYAKSSPGIYRTCWCQASECAVPGAVKTLSTFDVEIGILTIQGPYDGTYFERPEAPLWSHQWDLTLEGVNLHVTPTARLRLMKACPDKLSSDLAFGEEIDARIRLGYPKDLSGANYFFRDYDMRSIVPAHFADGKWHSTEYKLCWCKGPVCDNSQQFALKIGELNVLCEKGSEPIATGCQLCPVGRYKETEANELCEACYSNLWTTAAAGTRLGEECFCKPGYYYSEVTLLCTPCEINFYCPGGNPQDNGQRLRCPVNSGAWPRDICPLCVGIFPAQSSLDCSCIEGAEPGLTSCNLCPVDYFKFFKGNSTECILCEDSFSRSTSFGQIGQKVCTCDPGMYMVRDGQGSPLFCSDCPMGFWCYNGTINQCEQGRYTKFRRSSSKTDCLCGAGFFSNEEGECTPCPADQKFFKDSIGDEFCTQECPENSLTTLGARGPENCLCYSDFIQTLNMTSLEYRCEPDLEGIGKKPQTAIKLTAVFTEALFVFHPEVPGEPTRYPTGEYLLTDPLTATTIATELGLPDASQITLKPLPPIDVETLPNVTEEQAHAYARANDAQGSARRLQTQPVNSTNQSYAYANGSVIVPVQVIIWQGSVRETKSLQEDIQKINTQNAMASLQSADPLFSNLQVITFREEKTRLDFHWEYCPLNSAVPAGNTFVSAEVSCLCAPGYQPFWEDKDGECAALAPEDSGKCIPCCAKMGVGRYKSATGDFICSACNSKFPETDPILGASSSLECICQPGYYRPGTTEDCIICPEGHYCTGGTEIVDCPENEWTTEPGNDNESDCECTYGYFKPFPHEADKACIGCDPGYYKTTVANGIGRCTQRCSNHYGRRSTSSPAATSQEDCVCSVNSYLKMDATQVSGYQCEACPPEGVTCTGWTKNVTMDEAPGWEVIHAPPEANLGFFMLDRRYAVVEACRTQTAAEGSVCRGRGECADGHEGLLCGNCKVGWTRDKYPLPCRTCESMPPSGVLYLQILGDASFQAGLSWFLAYSALIKTETQKNVMTVLLRLLMHWSTQVGVLSGFNLTKLHPLATGEEDTEEDEAEDEGEGDFIEAPPNDTVIPAQEGFAFPGFFSEFAGHFTKVGEIIAGVGSTQEVIECLIDRRFQGDGSVELTEKEEESLQMWKLVGPAIWWFSYPGLNVIWVIFCAAVISYVVVPMAAFFGKPTKNPKKQRKKLRKKRLALKRKKAQEAKEAREKSEAQRNRDPELADPGAATHEHHHVSMSKDELDGFSDDSSSCSSSDSDEAGNTGDIETYLQYTPEFLALCDEMVASVANPHRFSYEYVQKDVSDAGDEDAAKTKVVEYYFQLFRKKPVYSREFMVDIAPWIIILLNNTWNVVTTRMLQLLYCENFYWTGTSEPEPTVTPKAGLFLMMRPDVPCYTLQSVHGILCMVAFGGLSLWSFGLLVFFYHLINSRDKQSRFVTRNFGYMLEGYEPQFWYWELTVKKIDLLFTAIVVYTNLAIEPRAKILLFSVQSALAFAVQLSTGPYDNRQLRLLDNMENLGLLVRQLIFTGISFSLLFGGNKIIIIILAAVLVVFVAYFFLHLVVHAADDWVGTQVAITKELFVLDHIEAQRKALKKMKKAGIPIDPNHLPEVNSYNVVHQNKYKLMTTIQNMFPFRGGNSETGYRHAQLLRCMWNGPGTDAVLYMPKVYEGWDYGTGFWRTMELYAIKSFNGLTVSHQQDAFAEHMGCFVALLLSLANFNQFPARFTDMVFFLARAVKRLKSDMEHHPNTVRPANPDDPASKPLSFRDRDWLKVAMLEELFSSMIDEGSDKRNLLERVRKGVRDVLKRENVPLEAAWDVLDRLTNDQLRRAVLSPVALFARVGFFLILSASTERCTETVAHYTMMHHAEKKARKKMYRFVQFALRAQIEENAELDMDWTYIHQVLEALPVVELKRLLKDPNEIIDVAKAHHYLLHDEQDEDFKSSTSVMTVEDLNSMLMFLQKLPYDQLHHIIEYTQMLLDFLSLPAKANWRDAVVARGQRMGKSAEYYRRARAQRIKMREDMAMDKKPDQDSADAEEEILEDAPAAMPGDHAVMKAPDMGLWKHRDSPRDEHHLVSLDDPFADLPDTMEAKLRRLYNSDMASSLDEGEEVPGGILCDMEDMQPDDNMSVSSLGSLDDAIRWSHDNGESDVHKDPLWKKIEGLRQKTGVSPFYNVTGHARDTEEDDDLPLPASARGEAAGSQYSSIPSLSGMGSSISSANSQRLMEDLIRRSMPRPNRRMATNQRIPEETHV